MSVKVRKPKDPRAPAKGEKASLVNSTLREPGQRGPITRTGVAAMSLTVIGAGVAVAGTVLAAPLEVGVGLAAGVVGTGLKVYDTIKQRRP